MRTIIVSGVSGSGKSLAYKTFENLGYHCMDNVPVQMLSYYQGYFKRHENKYDRVVLVVDARDANSINDLPDEIRKWKKHDQGIEILFLDAMDHILIQRFSETRHRHPLSKKGLIEDGIAKERELLHPIRDIATLYIDTSKFLSRDLQQYLAKRFSEHQEATSGLGVTVMSFGFKYGIPLNSDLLIDVRFLKNPFFEKTLKSKTGLDQEVQNFVLQQPDAQSFLHKITDLLDFLIPRYESAGKSYLQLSIGCTGGQHRSVAIAEYIASRYQEGARNISVVHREQE